MQTCPHNCAPQTVYTVTIWKFAQSGRHNMQNSLDPIYTANTSAALDLIDNMDKLTNLPGELPELTGTVNKNASTAAIILAGGSGERFGREGGKQLVEIAGKPILTWSAEAFDAVGDIGLIVIVCPEERTEEYLKRAIDPFPFVTPIVMAPAGTIRQESAFAGLERIPDEYEFIVIHDGARPLVTPELIVHTINTVKGNIDADGAVVAHPSIDTLKVVEDGAIMGTPDRRCFWNAQTPQVFRAGIYRRAQASALSDGFVGTDDSSLIERLGGKVLVVEGKRDNIKLTVPEDYLLLASAVRTMMLERNKEN
jgi:2-C-methyl-D-erythritol 4-phosphate cytidylyltransferase